MFHSLLVPLDGSEFGERSLPLARGIARATGASLHLAHVHVPVVPDHFLSSTQFHYEGLDLEEYDGHHREQEWAYLNAVTERVRSEGTTVTSALLDGDVSEELATYAEGVGTDMILISTHGHTGANRLWLGSVADALVRHTSRPLLVIRPEEAEGAPQDIHALAHILVALDGSTLAESVLQPVADIAEASGARVTLAHVVTSHAVLGAQIFPLLPDNLVRAQQTAEDYLERMAEPLRMSGRRVDTVVEEHRSVAVALSELAEARGADVIALATHGYSGMKRALLGSVADKVLRASSLPLILIRPSDGRD